MKRYKRPPIVNEEYPCKLAVSVSLENREWLNEYAARNCMFMYEAAHDLITTARMNDKLRNQSKIKASKAKKKK